jgi:imidazolonepropionase-like amidohydrolase
MKKLVLILLLAATAAAQMSPAVKEYVKYDQPAIVIAHVRIIDGTGAPAKEDQAVALFGGRIESFTSAHDFLLTAHMANATFIDATGMTLLPGLVLMHEHMFYPAGGGLFHEMGYSFPKLYLANGVTSLRTGGSVDPYADIEYKKLIDAGKQVGPKMHITGPYLEGPGSFAVQMHALTGPDDAKHFVDFWADNGATSFKAYNFLTRAELKAAAGEAHARGLKITGHLCSIGFREAAELGIDDLEHGLLVDTEFSPEKKPDVCPNPSKAYVHLRTMDVNGPEIQQTIKTLVEHHVAVTSTLPVFEMFVPARANAVPQRVLDAMSEPAKVAFLTSRAKLDDPANNQARYGMTESPWIKLFAMEEQFEHAFAKAGGTLLAGTDPTGNGGALPGFGGQREVELLVEAGFTPFEAIQICTQNGAKFMGVDKEVGTIAPGMAADLILVKGAPDKDIRDIERVDTVFKDGVGYDPQKLIDAVRGHVGLN